MRRIFLIFLLSCISLLFGASGRTPAIVGAAEPAVILPTGVDERQFAMDMVWQAVRKLPIGERPRVTLVLGGGGARGLSHVGVLRVFEEEQIPVDQIIGVSVGALIGALYAGGLPASTIDDLAKDIGWDALTDVSRPSLMKLFLTNKLIATDNMETYLKTHIGDRHFSDLEIPFACVATDIRTGERIIFKEGPVAIAARASATIPGLFQQVEYRHRSLVDGGLVDNLPIDIVQRGDHDIIIGVLPQLDTSREDYQNVVQILVRSIEIQKDAMIQEKKRMADFMIEPRVGMITMIDISKNKEAIEAGVVATRSAVMDLKSLIISRSRLERGTQQTRRP